MDYNQRYQELNKLFSLGKETQLIASNITITYHSFVSEYAETVDYDRDLDRNFDSAPIFGDRIVENKTFVYPIFRPTGSAKAGEAILLLHGLNERNWNKYLTWAEKLCVSTQKAVILFPIAYHINRSPQSWWNPRSIHQAFESRKQRNGQDRSMSFANVALSERISSHPHRFYSSGRQSVRDITKLIDEINLGEHELFAEKTQVDVFAYSIGAFLAQIIFLSNPSKLFTNSKLFLFCGGSIFSSMFGESRTIMDKKAFERLYQYYYEDFRPENETVQDETLISFNSMISPERNEKQRKSFFESMGKRIAGISLKNDHVIPYSGVEKAFGNSMAHERIKLLDFDYNYSHENPFPINAGSSTKTIQQAFNSIFDRASLFLA